MVTETRLYFDTCCFLDMLQHTTGISPKPERAAHVHYLRQFLDYARANGAKVFTSTLTVSECQFVKDDSNKDNHKRVFTAEVQRLIDGMLLSTKSGVMPVQPTYNIVKASRDLLWTHGARFTPLDSLHIATALNQKCQYFVTTDTKLDEASVDIVKAMGLGFCAADKLAHLLPDSYKQFTIDPSIRPQRVSKKAGRKA